NADTAGARRRRGDDLVAAVGPFDRRALDSFISLKILDRDQPVVRLHIGGKQSRRFTFVEIPRAEPGDARERASEIRLHEGLTSLVILAVLLKDPLRFGELRQSARVAQRLRLRIRERKSS